jgi:hypothetical protein
MNRNGSGALNKQSASKNAQNHMARNGNLLALLSEKSVKKLLN